METSSVILQELTSDWKSVHDEVVQLLPAVQPMESELMDIFVENQKFVEGWANRLSKDQHGNAPTRVRSAVIELLLWSLLRKHDAPELRKELLGALWQTLETDIRFQAEAMVRNLPNPSRRQDQIEQYMQEGFLQFAESMERYDPSNIKNTMLRSFVNTFYRSRMINIAKSKVMKKSGTECLSASDEPTDESQIEDRINDERLEEIEHALQQLAAEDERDAERVVAFRKFMIQGLENADIAYEMGRSRAWVTKSHQRISHLLREMLRR